MMMQELFNIFQTQLTGVFATPVLKSNADWTSIFIALDVVTCIATVTRDRPTTNVFQFTIVPFVLVCDSRTISCGKNTLVASKLIS